MRWAADPTFQSRAAPGVYGFGYNPHSCPAMGSLTWASTHHAWLPGVIERHQVGPMEAAAHAAKKVKDGGLPWIHLAWMRFLPWPRNDDTSTVYICHVTVFLSTDGERNRTIRLCSGMKRNERLWRCSNSPILAPGRRGGRDGTGRALVVGCRRSSPAFHRVGKAFRFARGLVPTGQSASWT